MNYGSILQTYATQKILSKMGFDVEIINHIRKRDLDEQLINSWTKMIRG